MHLTVSEALLRLALALAVGMTIGVEREWREKAAGFRTITLVTVGAALFVMAAGVGFTTADQARVAAGVVTGIGFLGAGAILRQQGHVTGLTTAAAVWAACALGIASAFGAYALVAAGSVIVLVVLVAFSMIDIADVAPDVRTYEVEAPYSEAAYERYRERFVTAGLRVRRKAMRREGAEMVARWDAYGSPQNHAEVTRTFLDDPAVSRFEVL